MKLMQYSLLTKLIQHKSLQRFTLCSHIGVKFSSYRYSPAPWKS